MKADAISAFFDAIAGVIGHIVSSCWKGGERCNSDELQFWKVIAFLVSLPVALVQGFGTMNGKH